MLIPHIPISKKQIQKQIDKIVNQAVDQMFDGSIKIDMHQGGYIDPVILKNYSQIEDLLIVPYKKIAHMENLIYIWKIENNNTKLPKEFFQLNNISKQIKWLENDKRKWSS